MPELISSLELPSESGMWILGILCLTPTTSIWSSDDDDPELSESSDDDDPELSEEDDDFLALSEQEDVPSKCPDIEDGAEAKCLSANSIARILVAERLLLLSARLLLLSVLCLVSSNNR
jgi:hypothetical protein